MDCWKYLKRNKIACLSQKYSNKRYYKKETTYSFYIKPSDTDHPKCRPKNFPTKTLREACWMKTPHYKPIHFCMAIQHQNRYLQDIRQKPLRWMEIPSVSLRGYTPLRIRITVTTSVLSINILTYTLNPRRPGRPMSLIPRWKAVLVGVRMVRLLVREFFTIILGRRDWIVRDGASTGFIMTVKLLSVI